jgi:hypothetical protein
MYIFQRGSHTLTRVLVRTSKSGFDTGADRHTRRTARLGDLDDFPVFDFYVFHDFTSPFLS